MHHIIWICIQNDVYVSDLWCSKRYFNDITLHTTQTRWIASAQCTPSFSLLLWETFLITRQHARCKGCWELLGHISESVRSSLPLCGELCINDFDNRRIYEFPCRTVIIVTWFIESAVVHVRATLAKQESFQPDCVVRKMHSMFVKRLRG